MKRADSGPSIAIIGAGFGGIGLGVRLRQAGLERFTIYDRAKGIGGTWWHNTYPGAEVDTPSVLYSFSFAPWNWSRTHVRQPEFQEYIENVVDRFGVRPHIRLGVDIRRVEWSDDLQMWELFSAEGLVGRANMVVSAVGMLSDPKLPDFPGTELFRGGKFHTAEWDHAQNLAGKRVAVVGSGSTGVQVVPALAGIAEHVLMFQREPGWVVPKGDRNFTGIEREAMNSPLAQRIVRTLITLSREGATIGGKVFRPGTQQNVAGEKVARAHIKAQLASRPDLMEAVTPSHAYMSKRPVVTDTFYPTLLREDVTLIPKAVSRVTEHGIVDADGTEHAVDAIVYSTGFRVQYLSSLKVHGRGGTELHDFWGADARAFLGMMVPSFPNFFMMYGPNTNAGSIITNLELQARYIVAAIKHMKKGRAANIEVRPGAFEAFDRWLMKRMQGTAFAYEHNYYKSETGRVQTQWPDSVYLYGALTKILRGAGVWKHERRVPRSSSVTTAWVADEAKQKVTTR